MTDLPALVTASVRTADGARYFDHADLTSHLAVWIKAELVRQHGIADVVVTAHPQNADEEDREIQLADTREIVANAEFAKRGSVVDGTLRFLLGEIDRLRAAVTVPASAPTDQAALRDRIRRAVCEAEGFAWDSDMLEPDEYGEVAAAVLAVLPAPADRAAILRELADEQTQLAVADDLARNRSQAAARRDLVRELRRLFDAASGPGRADDKTQQDETQAEAHPPAVTWEIEAPRRGTWTRWAGCRDTAEEAREDYDRCVEWGGERRPYRLIRIDTTSTVVAEHQPAAVPQPGKEA